MTLEDTDDIFYAETTADVEDDAEVGGGTRVWHFAHVMSGARIGRNCMLGQGVHVASAVVIGDGCKIQNGAQLFDGATLEDGVFIGPCVVFTNVRTPRAHVNRRAEYKQTLVKRGASIGANATILPGVTIGEYAMIGAGAVVTKDVPAQEAWVGSPAKFLHAVCKCGARADWNGPGASCAACATSDTLTRVEDPSGGQNPA